MVYCTRGVVKLPDTARGVAELSCPEIGRQLIKLIDLFDPHVMKNLYGEV